MVRQLERREVQDLHEGDTLEHEVHALQQPPPTVPEEWMREHGTTAQERRRPVRWMRWLGAAAVLAATAGVALVATTGGDDAVPVSDAVPAVVTPEAAQFVAQVPEGQFITSETPAGTG